MSVLGSPPVPPEATEIYEASRTIGARLACGKNGSQDMSWFTELGRAGILASALPVAQGGYSLGAVGAAAAFEGLVGVGLGIGPAFAAAAHTFAVIMPVAEFADDAQNQALLEPLAAGRRIGAFAITEPDAGSDALALRTTATQDADGWVLTGQKCFVTNANVADDLLVIARTGAGSGYFALTAFVVPTTLPGITVGPNHLTHQLRGATVADIHLDGVRVQASALLGGVGAGASVFRHAMAWERVCLFAAYIGAMCGVLDETAHYVEQRLQFGHALSHQQRVRHTLAELALEVESARGLLYRAAAALDRSEPEADRLGEMAKVAVSTTATTVGLRCTELQGAHGVFWSRAAQLVSDAVPALVFSGATHVQLNNIAASLGVGTA